MNKQQLIAAVTEKMQITHDRAVSKADVTALLDSLTSVITDAIARGDEPALTGIGKFKFKMKASRVGRNPRTGESIVIPAKKAVTFTPAKTLLDSI